MTLYHCYSKHAVCKAHIFEGVTRVVQASTCRRNATLLLAQNQTTCRVLPACSRVLTLYSPFPDDSDEDVSHCVLVARGCSPCSRPAAVPSVSPSIPIPRSSRASCSPHGSLVFSSSPTSSLPPLPCGSGARRHPSPKHDAAFAQGSLRLSHSNRNSAVSLLSMSTCSDTSYILGRWESNSKTV